MKNKQAFTLIELLVVVLIIGILAAVALPQYTQAVEKSRFATYRAMANSVAQAAETYYLANGSWPISFDELSTEFPADMNIENSMTHGICRKNNKIYCCMTIPTAGWCNGVVTCGDNNYHLMYSRRYSDSDGTPNLQMRCAAKEEKYQAICKSISHKTYATTGGTFTPDDWQYGYYFYHLD